MRILLVNSPISGKSIPEERYGLGSIRKIFRGEPLALETLAGNLMGHEVEILDLKCEPQALAAKLKEFTPDLVAITAMTCEANSALAIAREVKAAGNAVVVVGGYHPSIDPGFFNIPQIDYVSVGLGKASLRELVDQLAKNLGNKADVPGMAVTGAGGITFTPRKFTVADLCEEAPPRCDLTDKYRPQYVLPGLGISMAFVATAMGCTHNCDFCCVEALTGGKYLTAGTESIVRDIKEAIGRAQLVRLVDANTFGDVAKTKNLLDAIAREGLKFQFLADARADTIVKYPELFARLKAAGLRTVVVGFEEIDDAKLVSMNKGASSSINLEALKVLKSVGITVIGDFIVDPDYSEDDFEKLWRYIDDNKIDLPMPSIMTPIPGTRLYERVKDKVLIKDLDYYTFSNAVTPTRLGDEKFYELYADLITKCHKNAKI